jgi:broad specificity phosphatase PhoE
MTSQQSATTTPDLIVVRHARPEVHHEQSAASWPLSPAGHEAAIALGARLRAFGALRVFTSRERKAIQTAEAIASGNPVGIDDHFGEQGLGTAPFLSEEAFRERVVAHFRQPDARILGNESSRDAVFRFDSALHDATEGIPECTIPAIVSHGRIISAWLTTHAFPEHGEPPGAAELWESLAMPDAFLLQPDPHDRNRWIWTRLDLEGGI